MKKMSDDQDVDQVRSKLDVNKNDPDVDHGPTPGKPREFWVCETGEDIGPGVSEHWCSLDKPTNPDARYFKVIAGRTYFYDNEAVEKELAAAKAEKAEYVAQCVRLDDMARQADVKLQTALFENKALSEENTRLREALEKIVEMCTYDGKVISKYGLPALVDCARLALEEK